MIPIVLLHRADADREALAAWLDDEGFEVTCCTSASDVELQRRRALRGGGPRLVIVQEQAIGRSSEFACMGSLPLLVLGTERPLETPPGAIRLEEPYRFEQLADAIQDARARPPRPSEPTRRSARKSRGRDRGPPAPSGRDAAPLPTDLLLRGLAHAISNPLAAASGWLQFLEIDSDQNDGTRRAVRHMREEIGRIERMTQALSLIGGRPSQMQVEIDLFEVARRFRDRAREFELEVDLDLPSEPDAEGLFLGDPAEVYHFFDFLLDSYAQDRAKAGRLHLRAGVESGGDLELVLTDEGGTLPSGVDLGDLALLLTKMRHTRALALALGHELLTSRLGGTLVVSSVPDHERTSLVIVIPSAGEMELFDAEDELA